MPRAVLEKVFEERKLQFERRSCRYMSGTTRQGDAALVAKDVVDGYQVIERSPVARWVLNAAGHQHRAWRHQRVQIDQIVASINQFLV